MAQGHPETLPYASRNASWHPARLRLVGAASVLLGSVGFAFNFMLTGMMTKELYKQWFGRMKAMPLPVQLWLAMTGVEAALSAILAVAWWRRGRRRCVGPGGPRRCTGGTPSRKSRWRAPLRGARGLP